MKATLEFELPQEKSEFEDATKGLDYYCALLNFRESAMRLRKDSDKEVLSFDLLFGLLKDALDMYDVDLDK